MAVAAGDAGFDIDPVLIGDLARPPLVPVFPGVGAGAQDLALPIAAQHRAGRHEDAGKSGTGRPHQQGRGRLVAAAHEHGAVDGVAAQQLLHIHRQHVAVEHGGRLDIGFRERQRRQLDGQTAGLQNAVLDVLHAMLEMGVAGVDVRPGIDDGHHRPADPILRPIAHLHEARAMAEGAQIVGREPAGASELRGGLASCRHGVVHSSRISALAGARLLPEPVRPFPGTQDRPRCHGRQYMSASSPACTGCREHCARPCVRQGVVFFAASTSGHRP